MPPPCCMVSAASRRLAKMPDMSSGTVPITKQLKRVTLRPLPDRETGLLTFFDLANVGSVSAVMTEDLGLVERGMVRVLGRTAGGEARGCALRIRQFSANEAAELSR